MVAFLFHTDNPGTIRIKKAFAVKGHVVGRAVDKPLAVPLCLLQSLLPVPFRGSYPMAGVLFKMDELYAIPRPGRYPDTVFVFWPSHDMIV
jgi:hypothetical protein